MKIVCIDDEPLAVEDTIAVCSELSVDISAKGFIRVNEALEWIQSNPVDIALIVAHL